MVALESRLWDVRHHGYNDAYGFDDYDCDCDEARDSVGDEIFYPDCAESCCANAATL